MLLIYVSMGKQGGMNPSPYLEETFIGKKKTQGCPLRFFLLARIKFLGRKKLKRTLNFSPSWRGSVLLQKKNKTKQVLKNKMDLDPH